MKVHVLFYLLIFNYFAVYSIEPYKKGKIWILDNSNYESFVKENPTILMLYYMENSESNSAKEEFNQAAEILSRLSNFKSKLARFKIKNQKDAELVKTDRAPLFVYIVEGEKHNFGNIDLPNILRLIQKVETQFIAVKNQEEINYLTKDVPPYTINLMYVGLETDEEFKILTEIQGSIKNVLFMICISDLCQKKYPKALQSLVLFKNYLPDKELVFNRTLPENQFTKEKIKEWIDTNTKAYVYKFSERFIEIGFSKNLLALVVFRKEGTKVSKEYNKYLTNLQKKNDYSHISFYASDIDIDEEARKASQYFMVHDKNALPYVCIYDNRDGDLKMYPYPKGKPIDEENLKSYIDAFFNGKIERVVYDQTEEDAEKEHNQELTKYKIEDSNVKALVKKNFHIEVVDNDYDVFVLFYTNWCEHCHEIMPFYEKLARYLSVNENLKFMKIDVAKNTLDGYQINEFPTFKIFPKGKKEEPVEYPGNAVLGEFSDFLSKKCTHKLEIPEITKEFEDNDQDL